MTNEPTITPVLRLLEGPSKPGSFDLDREVTVLGKRADCDIVLDQNTVSKRHAQVVRRPEGYFLEDLNSRNKTFLDGRVLVRPERLRDGSTIAICDFRLVFSRPTVQLQDDDSSTILGVLGPSMSDPGPTVVRAEEKLRALMEINRDLAGTLDLKAVLAGVLTTLFRIFPQADRGFVLLKDETTSELIPSAIKSRHGDAGHLAISQTVFNLVLDRGQAVLSEDAPSEFDGAKSIAEARVLTLMAAPLWNRERRPSGILQLDTRERFGKFGTEDLDLLAAVAEQVGAAVETSRLHAVEARQVALDQEASDARAVQFALLPAREPDLPGYEFWQSYEPARSVGGDYFDYVPLGPATAPPKSWAVAVGDVEGKGMPAALLMARFSAEVRMLLHSEADPARVVTRLNQALCEAGSAGKFITFLLVIVDAATDRLSVVSAGHMGPVIRRADGRIEVIGDDEGGMPLGVDPAQSYQSVEARLGPGDLVVLYTDGVSEARNFTDRQFGTSGLKAALAAAPAGAGAAGETILEELRLHTSGCDQDDDITLLCFGRS